MTTEANLDYAFTFKTNNSLYMTETNEQWLAKAITLPIGDNEKRYYYDKHQNLFFEIAKIDNIVLSSEKKKQIKTQYNEKEISLLVNKLLLINSNSTDIIEIPRLSREERIAIQTEFIERIDVFTFYNELLIAVNKQDLTSSFILDEILNRNKKLNIFINYWLEFKFTRISYFINDFEEMNDIDIKTVQISDLERSLNTFKTKKLLHNENGKISKKQWWRFW